MTTTTSTLTDSSISSSSHNHLTSSISSLSSSTSASPRSQHSVTRVYKQAHQLFLTRRVSEALETLETVLKPTHNPEHDSVNERQDNDPDRTPTLERYNNAESYISETDTAQTRQNDEIANVAPIATASRAARIKVWSLYISILNEIVLQMGTEEGRKALVSGSDTDARRWKDLSRNVKDGKVWEDCVQWGYGGVEGAVDGEVVANLATLLLSHAGDQKTTQQRLETYLSSTSSAPSASTLASHLEQSTSSISHLSSSDSSIVHSPSRNNGTSTPRDLTTRLKLLEIYTLHVLPRNSEWDYAKQMIEISPELDEERREAFLSALNGLREEVDGDQKRETELLRRREEEEAAKREQKEREEREATEREILTEKKRKRERESKSLGGESSTSSSKSKSEQSSKNDANPRPSSSSRKKPQGPSNRSDLYRRRLFLMFSNISQAFLHLGQNISHHPMVMFRFVLFMLALVFALARRDVRERLKRGKDMVVRKLMETVGMGVKVSYV